MIEYVITENHLPANPTGYTARVVPARTIGFEELVDRVADRNTTVAKSDALGVIEDLCDVIQELVLDGRNITMPVANFRASVTGSFSDPGDGFDPERHRVVARLAPGKRLRQAMDAARVSKRLGQKPKPMPVTYIDVTTDARNSTLTAGGPGRLLGEHLRYDLADPEQGIYFVDAAGTKTKVEVLVLAMPAHLAFIVPALPPGDYTVQVRAILNDNDELRTGILDSVLTVA